MVKSSKMDSESVSLAYMALTYGQGAYLSGPYIWSMESGLHGKVPTSKPKLGSVMHKLHEVETPKPQL